MIIRVLPSLLGVINHWYGQAAYNAFIKCEHTFSNYVVTSIIVVVEDSNFHGVIGVANVKQR